MIDGLGPVWYIYDDKIKTNETMNERHEVVLEQEIQIVVRLKLEVIRIRGLIS